MTIKKIIDGLYFTIGMMLFNPLTGESKTPEELNEDDRTTYDACMGAIELLKAQEREIDFLKQMQLQLIQGMDEQKLGNMVGRVMKRDG